MIVLAGKKIVREEVRKAAKAEFAARKLSEIEARFGFRSGSHALDEQRLREIFPLISSAPSGKSHWGYWYEVGHELLARHLVEKLAWHAGKRGLVLLRQVLGKECDPSLADIGLRQKAAAELSSKNGTKKLYAAVKEELAKLHSAHFPVYHQAARKERSLSRQKLPWIGC